ncbi:Methyltransferase type 12 [Methylobacterium sp. 4-46]|uniref:class I SAM-dependent DNA methyltransferase n=1 Tax=unclassified Methylobacterium TaxID=2615210 RepID=UPI000165C5CC|nr:MULTISPECIES: methyltransferase domain-containing protein [Methylobacterium]ACA15191.1 Methyltransferase type 12 [Methylobacterium sp. 4-46]WFT80922.1 methyltransferase domain-containing protein [Methylobacterium nodulans]
MTVPLRSSGDLLADRRYVWAEAALAEGDAAAAADLAEQVLTLVPDYVPAWLLLGRAREAQAGDDPAARERARHAFAAALDLDPDDALGARLRLAELGAQAGEAALSPAYVRALFDGYAGRFERHLVEGLGYRAPAMLRDALLATGHPLPFRRALDLGCGTGLAARALDDLVVAIEGVDLSPGMLAEARRLGRYAALHEGDLTAFLAGQPAGGADLVVAADVFVYLRALGPAFAGVARALAPGGLFAFTLQAHAGEGAVLGSDGRYAHGEALVRAEAAAAGLAILRLEAASTRRERGAEVPGWLAVLGRATHGPSAAEAAGGPAGSPALAP